MLSSLQRVFQFSRCHIRGLLVIGSAKAGRVRTEKRLCRVTKMQRVLCNMADVRPSYCMETSKRTVKQSTLYDSIGTLVFTAKSL